MGDHRGDGWGCAGDGDGDGTGGPDGLQQMKRVLQDDPEIFYTLVLDFTGDGIGHGEEDNWF